MKLSQLPMVEVRAKTAFRSFKQAVEWYFQHQAQMTVPRSANSVSVEEMTLGTRVDGGLGSTRSDQLCLLADLEKCLPKQNAEPGWVVFVVAICDGGSVAACAEAIQRHCGVALTRLEVVRLLALIIGGSMAKMKARGLIPS